MGVKKRISLGMLTVTLGLSLISGGTFAYFNETEETEGTFSAGTLEVGLETGEENNTMINIGHLKPGDWIERDVTLKMKAVSTLVPFY
ncbi:hypothetical protein D7Z54_26700 [Salibacterium salarium]|uniref:SipW-cognate class signal peptide n=1 Tax=Salibacterium salarium TaxID=284579 RepID=A0A3R9PZD8_9BACI|nr:TasA family protein [Salibacterium salarium]RSL30305.1 hypothetical protein D7Z54_26700 [Salibacterium salarium]